ADPEAAAAEAEHRVELVQLRDARMNRADGDANLFRKGGLLFLGLRQELVERRIEEADRRRVSLQRAEDAGEVLPLIWEQLGQRSLPDIEGFGEDHFAHRVNAVALEKHVFSAAEAYA